MSRALSSLGLALVCLGSVHASASSTAARHQFALICWAPVEQKKEPAEVFRVQSPNAERVTQYAQQQRIAEEQTQSAELDLRQNIGQLQQLRSRYPTSPDLDRTITELQDYLNRVTQAEAQIRQAQAAWAHSPHPPIQTDAAVAASADQTNRLRQAAAEAQAYANQGRTMAERVIGNLNRASVGGTQPRPPTALPSIPAPSTPQPIDRSHSGVPEEQPTPTPGTDRAASGPPEQPKSDVNPGTSSPGVPQEQPTPSSNASQTPVGVPQEGAVPPPPPPPRTAPNRSDEAEWFNKLRTGLLQYSVPETMLWKVPSTVTVQILGEKAPPIALDNQTGEAPIKVARRMKVLVSAPDNPDEFIITPESDTQLEQFVPEDGPTTWHFSVTPRYTATAQRLIVQAWVIYDSNTQRELLPVYTKEVNVHVPSLAECVKRLFEGDPSYWLKYGLPGGAGFIFVSGVVAALWKWIKKKKTQTPQPVAGH